MVKTGGKSPLNSVLDSPYNGIVPLESGTPHYPSAMTRGTRDPRIPIRGSHFFILQNGPSSSGWSPRRKFTTAPRTSPSSSVAGHHLTGVRGGSREHVHLQPARLITNQNSLHHFRKVIPDHTLQPEQTGNLEFLRLQFLKACSRMPP